MGVDVYIRRGTHYKIMDGYVYYYARAVFEWRKSKISAKSIKILGTLVAKNWQSKEIF